MIKVHAIREIKYKGVTHAPGDVFELDTEKEFNLLSAKKGRLERVETARRGAPKPKADLPQGMSQSVSSQSVLTTTRLLAQDDKADQKPEPVQPRRRYPRRDIQSPGSE